MAIDKLTRRDLLRLGVVGGLGLAAGALIPRRHGGGVLKARADDHGPVHDELYGHGYEPPVSMGPQALDALVFPPPYAAGPVGQTRAVDLWVAEQPIEIAKGVVFPAWTFNGTVPGPILRANAGDNLEVSFRNLGSRAHNVHFHGSHDVTEDGWEPVPAGGSASYRIRAEPFGVHPYHCHAPPVSMHMGRGLFGTLIVDPPGGRPPAHEVVLVLTGFDVDGDGSEEIFGWNGVAGFFERYPIRVPVGELVRVYLLNMTSTDFPLSFHLHAQSFALFRTGTRLVPDEETDTVTLGPTERAILEFRLPIRGRYMFQPHQHTMAEHGAMGWFAAV